MKEFQSLNEVSLYCQNIANMSLDNIEAIPAEEIALLYCSAEKFIFIEVNKLAKKFDFPYPVLTEIPIYVRHYNWFLAACSGSIIVPFQTIFEADYNELVSILIHELCHFYFSTHCKSFWKLFEKCLKEIKLVSNDYNGWHFYGINITGDWPFGYITPFHWTSRQKQYKVVFKKRFLNYHSNYNYLVQPYYEKYQKYRSIQSRFMFEHSQEYSGELVYVVINHLIHFYRDYINLVYLFDSGRIIKTDYKELLYLKDEHQILCLHYDSRIKTDEKRIDNIFDQMKADNQCEFSTYKKCLIILEVDAKHPLSIPEFNQIKMFYHKEAIVKILYSTKQRFRNINKCEMTIIFSK